MKRPWLTKRKDKRATRRRVPKQLRGHLRLRLGFEFLEPRHLLSGVPELVRDINEGMGSAFGRVFSGQLTDAKDKLFFVATDGIGFTQLWTSDGSDVGTDPLRDFGPTQLTGGGPQYLTNVDGTLFFSVEPTSGPLTGEELWKSDGTVAGTELVRDIAPAASSSPADLTNVNGTLFFAAHHPDTGVELWKSNGIETTLVADINPGDGDSSPANLTNVDGALYFTADDGMNGRELWRCDGSGTMMVRDIADGIAGSFPSNLTDVDGILFFRANDGLTGFDLWRSDSTAGAVLVKDINTGNSSVSPFNLTNVDGTLFFTAYTFATGFELWKSNGTAEGTKLVKETIVGGGPQTVASAPDNLTNVNGTLFFTATNGNNGIELWKSDGTDEGTKLVADIRAGSAGSEPQQLIDVNGTLFFTANDGMNGRELWKNDATGTMLVDGIRPGSSSSNPQLLTAVNNALFFTAEDDAHGRELWRLEPEAPALPDLDVETVTVDPPSGMFGEQFEVSWRVRNRQEADATAGWVDHIYLSSDSMPDDRLLATYVVLPDIRLAFNEFYDASIPVTPPLDIDLNTGDYQILIKTDAFNQLVELDKANNFEIKVLPLSVPPLPDLFVDVDDVQAPLEALSGQTIEVSWTITNQGDLDFTGTLRDQLFLSADDMPGNDEFYGTFDFTSSIARQGGFIVRTQQITLPVGLDEDRYVIIRTDATDSVYEHAGELNNTTVDDAAIDIKLKPFPNLEVMNVDGPDDSVFAGASTTVTWEVHNTEDGSTDAPAWYDGVWLSTHEKLGIGLDWYLGESPNESYLNGGESYPGKLEVTIPEGIPEEEYYFIVKTDHRNQVFEFDDEDDNEIDFGPVQIELPPVPDLQVASVRPMFDNVFSGETLRIDWDVVNFDHGNSAVTRAQSWIDEVYLSHDASLDTQVDVFLGRVGHSGDLQRGEDYPAFIDATIPVDFWSPAEDQPSYILVRTDADNRVAERGFEGNNEASKLLQIRLTPPADLGVPDISAAPNAVAGKSLKVDFKVVNDGSNPPSVSSWTNAFYLSVDDQFDAANDLLLGTRRFSTNPSDLQGGTNSGPQSETFTLPNGLAGDFYVFVDIDTENEVFEWDDVPDSPVTPTSNYGRSEAKTTIVSLPADLFVTELSAGPVAEAGAAILVNWTVLNQGMGDTIRTRWTDHIYLSNSETFDPDQDLLLASFQQIFPVGMPLEKERHYDRSELVAIPFDFVGEFQLHVVTDFNNEVFEDAGEANNISESVPLSITRQTPDLRVTNVAADINAVATGQLSVTWSVQNFGNGATNVNWWEDDIYLSSNNMTIDAGDVRIGRVTHSGNLEPFTADDNDDTDEYTTTRSFTLPAELSGEFFVLVRTDRDDRVLEDLLENNNDGAATFLTTIALSPVPDLVVTSVDAPLAAISGQSFDVTWSVSNDRADSGPRSWDDYVYLSLDQIFDPAADLYLGFARQSRNLTAGQPYTTTASFNIPPGRSGPYYVFVRADGGNTVNERAGEGASNIRHDPTAMQINLLPPADLIVGTITIPDDTQPGQQVTVTYTVHNSSEATGTASGNWFDSVYISSNGQWDLSDPLLGRFQHTSSLPDVPPGGSYPGSVTAPLPGVMPGEYHVIVRSDIRNAVPESDETNNFRASLERFDISVPELIAGTPANGLLNFGQEVFYRIAVPPERAGESLIIDLGVNNPNSSNELYVRFGDLPSRSEFDFTYAEPFSSDQRVVIPSAQAGTYYVLAVGDPLQSSTGLLGNYTLDANFVLFSVFNDTFGVGGTAGNRTIEIDGVKFDRSVTATLTDGNGFKLPAASYYRTSETKLYATFDLTQVAPGTYAIKFEKPTTGEFETVNSALSVVAGGGGNLLLSVNAPDATPRPRPGFPFVDRLSYRFTISWGNSGINDIPTPVLGLTSSDEFGESIESIVAGGGTTVEVFYGVPSSSGPPGILLPGSFGERSLVTRNSPIPAPLVENIHYSLAPLFDDPSAVFDWQAINEFLSPPASEDDLNKLNDKYGPLASGFLELLSKSASLLPQGAMRDISSLIEIAISQGLSNESASISGRIREPSFDVAYSGRTMFATHIESGDIFTTAVLNDGTFYLNNLNAGTYSLQIENLIIENDFPEGITLLQGEQIHDLELAVSRGGQIDLSITDMSDGPPLDGVAIVALPEGTLARGQIWTSEDLNVSLAGISAETVDLLILADGRGAKFIPQVAVSDEIFATIEAVMDQEAKILGSVQLAGSSIGQTTVRVVPRNNELPTEGFVQVLIDGRFEQRSLPSGEYDLVIDHPGYVQEVLSKIDLEAGEVLNVGEITLVTSTNAVLAQVGPPTPYVFDFKCPFVEYDGTTGTAWKPGDHCDDCDGKFKSWKKAAQELNELIGELKKLEVTWKEECSKYIRSWRSEGLPQGYSPQKWIALNMQASNRASEAYDRAEILAISANNKRVEYESLAKDYWDCFRMHCEGKCIGEACEETSHVGSYDPNDIVGPSGSGEERWVPASNPLPYTIRFENDAELATAPAREVRITQQLDQDLDFRTFRLGTIGFGGLVIDAAVGRPSYQGRVDLTADFGVLVDVLTGINVQTGEVFLNLTSIDPVTGSVPTTPLLGFLPPNVDGTEGQGFVSYSVSPRNDVVTSEVIDAQARIIFDINPPIDTPPIFNTIDADIPVSSVTALPAQTGGSTFFVSWEGEDDADGSGLASYTIYVLKDGGPFRVWLTETTLTAAQFVGEPATQYAFYSVARDNAGNVEAAPGSADGVTMTPATPDTVAPSITGSVIQSGLTQRSYVDRLQIDFSEQVNLADLIAHGSIVDAITLTNLGVNVASDPDQQISLTAEQFQYDYDEQAGISQLTWSLDEFAGTNFSLADGLYEFVIDASFVTDLAGNPFDGDGDEVGGDSFVLAFHRLQGDVNGDTVVDSNDSDIVNQSLGALPASATWNANADLDRDNRITVRDRLVVARALGNDIVPAPAALPAVAALQGDFNGDGSVDAADYTVWRINLGRTSLVGPISGDADGDVDVDNADHLIWKANFGRSIADATRPVDNQLASLAVAMSVESPSGLEVSVSSTTAGEQTKQASDRSSEATNELQLAGQRIKTVRDAVFGAFVSSYGLADVQFNHHNCPRAVVPWVDRISDDEPVPRELQLNLALKRKCEADRPLSPSANRFAHGKRGPMSDGIDEAFAQPGLLEVALAGLKSSRIQRTR